MTEEIIIDGVDVARCKDFLEPDGCDNTDTLSMTCSRNNNCYYKQLKRLEQENKELIHYLACMTEQRNKLKTILEEIRTILNKECGIISNAIVVGLINEVLDEEMS